MKTYLRAVQPVNVSQSSPNLPLLELLLGHLLLLPGPELHIIFAALGVTHVGSAGGGWCGRADVAANIAGAGARVLEAVHVDGEMTLVGDTAISDMPLLGAERADELFVVRDHNDTTLVVTDSDSETTKRVTVQEVSRFVKNEEMGVVPHSTS